MKVICVNNINIKGNVCGYGNHVLTNESLHGKPFYEEGYVTVDKHFNRIKIKNPTYLAVHRLKDQIVYWKVMTIVKENEVEEFVATFQDRKEELYQLKSAYDNLLKRLKAAWRVLSNIRETYDDEVRIHIYE